MKVLFCSPFLNSDKVAKGGINQWGQYIVSYWKEYARDTVDLIPVSFDRHHQVCESRSAIGGFVHGVKDLLAPMREAMGKAVRYRPDLVHICTSGGQGALRDLALIAMAKLLGAKVAIHLHFGRIPQLVLGNTLEWKLLRLAIGKADAAIAMNQSTLKALRSCGFKNACYLPNPLDVSVLREIKALEASVERTPRRLVFVGHVFRSKGVFEAVEACKGMDGVTLRLVGKCPEPIKAELRKIAGTGDGADWLEFTGEVSHRQVIEELLQADVFVFPSYSEGFPNVVLEAMACGCPIAASNVGAIPEMLDVDGDACGMCYEPRSVEEVRRAVSKLLGDARLKAEYAAKAKKRVEEQYAIPIVWKQMVDIWKC